MAPYMVPFPRPTLLRKSGLLTLSSKTIHARQRDAFYPVLTCIVFVLHSNGQRYQAQKDVTTLLGN